MRILALSEHFWPRFGGTATYVHKTCEALSKQGIVVDLLVPGPRPPSVSDGMMSDLPYAVHWIDADYPFSGEPPRSKRYAFCRLAEREVLERCANPASCPDTVHVMFGLFLMEVLDTRRLNRRGIQTVATVHNIPPMECARTWDRSPLKERLLERIRLAGVAQKNAARLRKFPYNLYIVPSPPVAETLRGVLGAAAIEVVGHGVDEDLLTLMNVPADRASGGGVARIFTAGGWAPHKRQALIPEIIALLQERGVEVLWETAGPSTRIAGYREAVDESAMQLDVSERLIIDGAVDRQELAACYDRANIYVQPSTEEGYCLTALDAAAAGLPVIGCPAGALPEICSVSGGRVVQSTPAELADAIATFVETDGWIAEGARGSDWIRREMSWGRAAERLIEAMRHACDMADQKIR